MVYVYEMVCKHCVLVCSVDVWVCVPVLDIMVTSHL